MISFRNRPGAVSLRPMKRCTAFFLSFLMFAGSLFPQTDIEEVYKIPGLFTHFQEHRAKADLSFWQFLEMHYSPLSRHARTPHPHTKIPFYNHMSAGFLFVLTEQGTSLDPPSVSYFSFSHHFQYAVSYVFQTFGSLLRPPQA